MSKRLVIAALILAVFLLHQDYWNWAKSAPLFGFLPVGLAYHAAYCVLSAALMWVLVRFAWPRELDEMEARSERGSKEDGK
jgi:hypothetical protein